MYNLFNFNNNKKQLFHLVNNITVINIIRNGGNLENTTVGLLVKYNNVLWV